MISPSGMLILPSAAIQVRPCTEKRRSVSLPVTRTRLPALSCPAQRRHFSASVFQSRRQELKNISVMVSSSHSACWANAALGTRTRHQRVFSQRMRGDFPHGSLIEGQAIR